MNNYLSSLSEILSSAVKSINTSLSELTITANLERQEMLALLMRMRETNSTIRGIGAICRETVNSLNVVSNTCTSLADKIGEAMEDPLDRCPEIPYESLVDFCEDCGGEISVNDNYFEDETGFGIICSECKNVEEA